MKIVQSFWSKPLLQSNNDVYQNRFNGGWINFRYALLSMVYSCLTIKKFYPQLELYTDDYGVKLFKDVLGLPYSNVYNCLNNIVIDEGLWAFSKILTYSMQDTPFLHLDNDIFLWNKLPKNMMSASVVCQNIEYISNRNSYDYLDAMDYIHNNMPNAPEILQNAKMDYAANMGIFGGNDISFIKYYTSTYFQCLENMYDDIIKSGRFRACFNIILEQLLLSECAKRKSIPVKYVWEPYKNGNDITSFFCIETAQFDSKFIHCIGELKHSEFICEQIEYRVKMEYPEYYNRIIYYLEQRDLKYPLNENSMSKYDDFKFIYSRIRMVNDKNDLLKNFSFRLKSGCDIIGEGENWYVVNKNGCTAIRGWGKMLFYFKDYTTGNSVCKYIHDKGILPMFSMNEIRQSIFYLIIQGLFMNKCLEIK